MKTVYHFIMACLSAKMVVPIALFVLLSFIGVFVLAFVCLMVGANIGEEIAQLATAKRVNRRRKEREARWKAESIGVCILFGDYPLATL